VSGKGAAAALYGGLMSGLLRTLAPRHARSLNVILELVVVPAEVVSVVNHPDKLAVP